MSPCKMLLALLSVSLWVASLGRADEAAPAALPTMHVDPMKMQIAFIEPGQPTPEPAPPPKPEPLAPTLEIEAPTSVELGHLVHVRLIEGGGPVREREILFEPEVDPEDILPDPNDPTRFAFTAPADVYAIRVLVIGEQKGFCKREVRVAIRDNRPKPTDAPPAAAAANAAGQGGDAVELLRTWASEVKSRNREREATAVAKAARDTAVAIRNRRVDPAAAVDEWEKNAYLELGPAFRAWKMGPNSFFGYAAALFADNAKLAGADQANLLDQVATILEGRP